MSSIEAKPDLDTLMNQSKSQHTIRDKSTGQVLGYALLFTDQAVSAEQVQLVPWQGVEHQPLDGAVQPHCPIRDGPDDVLVSDLDLSQISSRNETMEEDLSSQANDEMEVQGNLSPTSKPRQNENNHQTGSDAVKSQTAPGFLPGNQTPPVSTSALPNSSDSVAGTFNQKLFTSPSSSNITKPVVFTKLETLTSDSVANLGGDITNISQTSSELNGKRNLEENVDTNSKKKKVTQQLADPLAGAKQVFLPGMKGRYDAFYEDSSDEGVAKQYRRVKCLLCGDGRLLSLGNFHRHIKAIHEPPVKCDTCGREFNGEQIRIHKKKCIWSSLEFVEQI
eukprot:GFUD01118982.1.p1 GENE.GFUD01118982.1~~GFUD01118982.1.p1  ORF type:complete len:335 (-),score=91.62 GFUD01118982.1:97-1101(-)